MIRVDKLKKIVLHPFSFLALLIVSCGLLFWHFYIETSLNKIKEATESYREGESSTLVAKRKAAFNRALDLYLQMEKQYHPEFGDGKLYYNIANTYYQLQEYPQAILYYYRAQRLRPYDQTVTDNLSSALEKATLALPVQTIGLKNLFSLHTFLPLPIRFQLFFSFLSIAFVLYSLYLWNSNKKLRNTSIGCLVVTGVIFVSIFYSYFIENPSAVVIKATNLYRGAGTEFAQVTEAPLKAGSKVIILQTDKNDWLKIRDANQTIGFVHTSKIKVI